MKKIYSILLLFLFAFLPFTAPAQVIEGTHASGVVAPKNYIRNGSAVNNTRDWSVYNDGAALTRPLDGSGGTANVTINRSVVGSISDGGFFVFNKPAQNVQGEGWSVPFSVDQAARAKVLKISFKYTVSSPTFTAGSQSTDSDLIVYVYDVDNARVIEPSSIKLFSNSSTLVDEYSSYFQTSSNSTNYRLIFHVASNTTNSWSLKIDDVSISLSQYVYGTPITDWVSYTPTFNNLGSPPTSILMYWRRVGQNVEVRGTWVNGTVGAGSAYFSLPSGLSSSLTVGEIVGSWGGQSGTGAGYPLGWSPGLNGIYFTNANWQQALTGTNLGTGNIMGVQASVPIQGWSSSVQMSDSADTRVVAARYFVTTGASTTSTNPINYETRDFDTHSAVTTGAGVWKFTAPVAGIYEVNSFNYFGATAAGTVLFKNGVTTNIIVGTSIANTTGISGKATISLVAGDFIALHPNATVTPTSQTTVTGANYIEIKRISGPSAIAASEKIAVKLYRGSSAQTISSSSLTKVQLNTKTFSTHGGEDTTTNYRWTAPRAGFYAVSANAYVSNAGNDGFLIAVYKNGVEELRYYKFVASTGDFMTEVNGLVQLNAGDYLELYVDSLADTSYSLQPGSPITGMTIYSL